jgi:ketosteroid isomerase-like protein
MKTLSRWLAPLAVVAIACAPAAEPAAPMVDTAADEAAIMAVRDAELASINSGSGDLSHMTANAVSMPPGEPAIQGTEALATWIAGMIEQYDVNVNYTSSNLTLAGDWAIESYAGDFTMTPKAGGDGVSETLKGIHIYGRQADGSWKMTHDIWNSDAPPPAM